MKFHIKQTIGSEVVTDKPPSRDALVYYGGPPPETGRWHLDINEFEDFVAKHLAKIDFGKSIETYFFGLEIAELQDWGTLFTATSEYTSYRPKMKALVSVGQIEWTEVKHLSAHEQLAKLGDALIGSIERVSRMKRRPKDFDAPAFAMAARLLMASCDASMFAISKAL